MSERRARLVRAAPWIFIVIWASGYVVAEYGLPYAEPLTFLSIRFLLIVAMMLGLAWIARAPWPRGRAAGHIAVAGLGLQAGYLSGVWGAVELGMPAGVIALIVNTQPILTAFAGPLIGERVTGRQWVGLALGFGGVALVVEHNVAADGLSLASIALALMALVSMTAGTLYQKRFCPSFDLRTGQAIQFSASLVILIPLALLIETQEIDGNARFWGAMAWSVLVLTGGGISLLYLMLRHGEATTVTSYLYLVPPITALIAWIVVGTPVTAVALTGMVIAALGVWFVVRPSP